MDMSKGKRTAIVAALFAALSACGGGGSSTPSTGTTSTGTSSTGGSSTTITSTTTTTTTATTTPPNPFGVLPYAATVGTAYTYTFTATGSTPITYRLTSGVLPTGLSLSSSGTISGTPTLAGTYNATVTASNGTLPDAMEIFTIVVAATPATGAFCTTPLVATILGVNGGNISLTKVDATHFSVTIAVSSVGADMFVLQNLVFVQGNTTGQINADLVAGSNDFTFPYAQYGTGVGTYGASTTQIVAVVQVPSWFHSGPFTMQYTNSPVTCTW